eukprot:COSAG02_NODE_220_length_28426_cov_28.546863_18_plen_148_part_00
MRTTQPSRPDAGTTDNASTAGGRAAAGECAGAKRPRSQSRRTRIPGRRSKALWRCVVSVAIETPFSQLVQFIVADSSVSPPACCQQTLDVQPKHTDLPEAGTIDRPKLLYRDSDKTTLVRGLYVITELFHRGAATASSCTCTQARCD